MAGSPVRAPRRWHAAHSGITMPAGQVSIFFTLPVELRLEVYKFLIEDCLENGYVTDLAGLLHCCRQIHQEIESEFMSAARPLLAAKNNWETACDFPGVLSMQILPKLNSKGADLSIRLPIRPTFGNDDGITATQQCQIWDASLLLREVFARNWSTLTLSFENGGSQPMTISQIHRIYKEFFYRGGSNSLADLHHVRHIHRLVLCYDECADFIGALKCLMNAFTWVHSHAWITKNSNRIREGWVSKLFEGRQPGWRLIIDSKEGLDPVMEAITQLTFVDGHLEHKYNPFDGISDRLLLHLVESSGLVRYRKTNSDGTSVSESESSDTESEGSSHPEDGQPSGHHSGAFLELDSET